MLAIGGHQDAFDAWVRYKHGHDKTPPMIQLKIPQEIREVLLNLTGQLDDAARHFAFTLLDLPQRYLKAIAHMIHYLRKHPPPQGASSRSCIHYSEETVVVVTATIELASEDLRDTLTRRLVLEKYRYRANKAI